MEVFCPECPQGYRIPVDRTPTKPRMVMCRSCGATWRQNFSQAASPPSALISTKDQSNLQSVKRPVYPNSVLTVLREEAALEAKLRN